MQTEEGYDYRAYIAGLHIQNRCGFLEGAAFSSEGAFRKIFKHLWLDEKSRPSKKDTTFLACKLFTS